MEPIDFKGECVGVRLKPRSSNPNDRHVLIQFIVHDDGNWFEDRGSASSSYWVGEYLEKLAEAQAWMQKNCDPDITDGKQYGWAFRPKCWKGKK